MSTRRGRVAVDIKGLNRISVTDSYPMPLQGDIISAVQGAKIYQRDRLQQAVSSIPDKIRERAQIHSRIPQRSEAIQRCSNGFQRICILSAKTDG